MKRRAVLRFVSYVVLGTSVFVMPWWFSLLLAVIFLSYFNNYYEAAIFALLMDALYAAPLQKFNGAVLVSFGIVVILVFLSEMLKKRLYLGF